MSRLQRASQLLRAFGPGWVLFRAFYALQMKSGAMARRLPATDWPSQPLQEFLHNKGLGEPESYLLYRLDKAPRFFFTPQDRLAYAPLLSAFDTDELNPQRVADDMAAGTWPYFEHTPVSMTFPPDWHINPLTQQSTPKDRHWSHIGDFGQGDIKVIWELSRFGFAYALVRAYWRTGEERYAELFWQLVEDWRAQNAPQQGANWKCGQETSFRVMAWCFGLYGTLGSKAATAQRVTSLAEMMAVAGQRIAANLSYALSQDNNHGISEGVGLWTIGTLFPEFKQAAHWRETGRRVLEEEGCKLIYEDGSFSQHSTNYHRVMLQDYLWALRLGEVLEQPFSGVLQERVQQAGNWLYQIQDEQSGGVPCYGANDGALILPLSNCDYQDYRPVVGASHCLSTQQRCYENGPWNEDLLWLFGPSALQASTEPLPRPDFQAPVGGYYTLRSEEGFLFTRCGSFRHRPSQADMLHVDIWWRGQNIALDAGTYSYNAEPPWNNVLVSTAFHNTVMVDGCDQMAQAGKFLFLPWLEGHMVVGQSSPSVDNTYHKDYMEGRHNGYERLPDPVVHRRAIVRLGGDSWLVWDELLGKSDHELRLHWLLQAFPYEWRGDALVLQTPQGDYFVQCGAHRGSHDATHSTTYGKSERTSLVKADPDSPRGWRAPYYGSREPALSWEIVQRAAQGGFWTLFSPELCGIETETEFCIKTASGSVIVVPGGSPNEPLIKLKRANESN